MAHGSSVVSMFDAPRFCISQVRKQNFCYMLKEVTPFLARSPCPEVLYECISDCVSIMLLLIRSGEVDLTLDLRLVLQPR